MAFKRCTPCFAENRWIIQSLLFLFLSFFLSFCLSFFLSFSFFLPFFLSFFHLMHNFDLLSWLLSLHVLSADCLLTIWMIFCQEKELNPASFFIFFFFCRTEKHNKNYCANSGVFFNVDFVEEPDLLRQHWNAMNLLSYFCLSSTVSQQRFS